MESLQDKTRKHYGSHPFDFLTQEEFARIGDLQPEAFLYFARLFLNKGDLVADVGCGPGRDALFLKETGIRTVGIDLSFESLQLAKNRARRAHYVCATNLDLPFHDQLFDAVISDGVIHHTPDAHASFLENVRVTKIGGFIYLAVYKRWRYYYYIYNYLGRPVRWLVKHRYGRYIVHNTFLPAYFLVHIIKYRGKRTWAGAKNLFYDYMVTPIATFYNKREVVEWGINSRLELLYYDNKTMGSCHAFIFKKLW